jgi:hypothetical protein
VSKKDGTGDVYELIDPRNGQSRYVGCTLNFERRKRQHMTWGYQNRELELWKTELFQEAGLKHEVRLIETGIPRDLLRARELHWIRERASQGCELLNMPSGRIRKEDLLPISDALICAEQVDEILEILGDIRERLDGRCPSKAVGCLLKAMRSVSQIKNSLPGIP